MPRRFPVAALALSFLACLLLDASPARALAGSDRIELSNGSVVIGRFVDADEGVVKIETDFAGTLSIDQQRIVAMNVQSPLTLQFSDGSLVESDSLVVAEKTVDLDARSHGTFALDELTRINPEPWELGRGYRHRGNASSGFNMQRGNTVVDELDYRVESRWTGLEDRYTLKLEGEIREANRRRNAENWMITAKYDRFQVGEYYVGFSASMEEDRFADLDLRTRAGPYVGRRFLDRSPLTLELEAGVSYIEEQFGSAPDREYMGLTWNVRSESDYLGNDSRLYVEHTGIRNLADRASTILDTTVGLSFPLLGGLQGATEVVLNYNSGAVENVEELDQTYRFRLGYTW
jgi:putative salt-induced outer membrane protein YdiY